MKVNNIHVALVINISIVTNKQWPIDHIRKVGGRTRQILILIPKKKIIIRKKRKNLKTPSLKRETERTPLGQYLST